MNVIDQEAPGRPVRVPNTVGPADRTALVRPARYRGGHRPPARWRTRSVVAALATLVLLVVVGALAFGTAAYAATPRCNYYGYWADQRETAQTDLFMPGYWPSGSGSATWKCLMSSGDRGEDVKEMQRGLNLCYGSATGVNLGVKLTVDGVFGPATKSALIKAQKYHGLTADGVYGAQTAAGTWHRGHTLTPYGWFWTCTKPGTLGLT